MSVAGYAILFFDPNLIGGGQGDNAAKFAHLLLRLLFLSDRSISAPSLVRRRRPTSRVCARASNYRTPLFPEKERPKGERREEGEGMAWHERERVEHESPLFLGDEEISKSMYVCTGEACVVM